MNELTFPDVILLRVSLKLDSVYALSEYATFHVSHYIIYVYLRNIRIRITDDEVSVSLRLKRQIETIFFFQ